MQKKSPPASDQKKRKQMETPRDTPMPTDEKRINGECIVRTIPLCFEVSSIVHPLDKNTLFSARSGHVMDTTLSLLTKIRNIFDL